MLMIIGAASMHGMVDPRLAVGVRARTALGTALGGR